jgi:gag-polypeptide of LTR copia-type
MSTDTKRTFPCLTDTNWGQWSDNMEAYLNTKELWEYVDGSTPQPAPADPTKATADEKKEIANWKRKCGKASGEIWLALEDNQKVHVKDLKADPAAMWAKLESVHLQKKPGTRFNAYDNLFSIRKEDNETLPALMARAEKASQDIKSLRPSHFTLDMLDKELLAMSLIRALPAEYNTFASSLLLLDSLDVDKLKSAFVNEESQRLARNVASTSSSLAMHTSSSLNCTFCGGTSHAEKDCFLSKKRPMRPKGS